MKKIISRQSGFTLLEMIFSLGFLLMTISAILALTYANITGEAESENQVVANNLARESIEVVRNIRDGNWLAKLPFNTSIDCPTCTAATKRRTVFNQDTNTWTIDIPAQVNDSFVQYRSVDGIYSYDSTKGSRTMFSRHIFLDYICGYTTGSENINTVCAWPYYEIGLRVRSVVSWQEKGRLRQVMIEDFLYDWK